MAIQAGGIEAYLDLNTGKFDSKIIASQTKLDGFANKMKSSGAKLTSIGGKLTKGVTLPLAAVGAGALKVGMDFQAGMSEVEAISGATGKDMEKLEGLAREMGATTKFSATEAADGLKYMALAGWDTEQMASALPAVLDLAAASGEDLGVTSDIVTDALSAFGMEAKDAAGFADLLASASSNSNTDVSMLGESFKYVAPVMGALGATADDTALALGLMANAGIKGSQAGTQLRTVMSNMVKPTKQQAAAMKKYGVELVENADGSVNLKGTMDNLRSTLGGLDETQQAAAASTIFGKEAMSGALAIVNASEEDYAKLTKATTDYDGAAKKMADTMQDNLQGSIQKMKSALEEAGISIAENLIPMAEKGVAGIQSLADGFNSLDDEQRENIVKWGLILAAAGPVITIFGKILGVVGTLAGGISTLAGGIGSVGGATGLVGSLGALGPLAAGGIAIAGIVGISKVIKELSSDGEELEEVNINVADSFIDQSRELGQNINVFEELSDKAKLTNTELAELNRLNEAISKSSNPGEIAELKDQYEALAEKSGLSKEELEQLFEANSNIIAQSPDVETSIDSQGNAWISSTEKAQEYREELNNISMVQLDAEIEKAQINEKKHLEDKIELEKRRGELITERDNLQERMNDGELDHYGRVAELNDEIQILQEAGLLTDERRSQIKQEQLIMAALANGEEEYAQELYSEYIDMFGKELENIDEKLQKKDEELGKEEELLQKKADILLMEEGITETGDEGLAKLDERLQKTREEIELLEAKKEENGNLNEQDEERLQSLKEQNIEHQEALLSIFEETGLFNDINELAQAKLALSGENNDAIKAEVEALTGVKVKNDDILGSLDEQKGKLTENLHTIQEEAEATGKKALEQEKELQAIESKLGKNAEAKRQVLEELGLWEGLTAEIREGIEAEIERGNQTSVSNSKLEEAIQKEIERNIEAGKDVDKVIRVTDDGTIETVNKEAVEPKDKIVYVNDDGTIELLDRDAMDPKEKTVSVVDSNNSIAGYNAKAEEGKKKPVEAIDPTGSIPRINRSAEEGKRKPIFSFDQGGALAKLDRVAGADKRKPVKSYDQHGSLAALNRNARSPVSKVINFVAGIMPKFADGTPPGGHKGGLAIVGDGGGEELIQTPSGNMFLSPPTDTMLNLAKGTHVYSHEDTKKMLGNIPKYADGTRNNVLRGQGANRVVNTINNVIDTKLLAKDIVGAMEKSGLTKPAFIEMDGKVVGKGLIELIDEELQGKHKEKIIGKGGVYV